MKSSSVYWVIGFATVAYCSISAPEYGQWNTAWIGGIPKSLNKVTPALNNASRVTLLQLDKFINSDRYKTPKQDAPIAVNGRDKDCLRAGEGGDAIAPSATYKGFTLNNWSSFYSRGEAIVGGLDAKAIAEILGTPAYCQTSKNTARWLPQFNGKAYLDIKFDKNNKLKGYKWSENNATSRK